MPLHAKVGLSESKMIDTGKCWDFVLSWGMQ